MCNFLLHFSFVFSVIWLGYFHYCGRLKFLNEMCTYATLKILNDPLVIAYSFILLYNIISLCGYSLVVESHASDLVARVRFSLPAPLSKIVAPDENIDKSTVKG